MVYIKLKIVIVLMHSQCVSIVSVQKVRRKPLIHRALAGNERTGERWEEKDIHKEN